MAKFVIQPHGRLNDWVADEKGYFEDEGLQYEINIEHSGRATPKLPGVETDAPVKDVLSGAFESYLEGGGRKGNNAGDVSCACHWTVNQAAKVEDGVMWGKDYSVCESAIVVPPDSEFFTPEDLAGVEVSVGYHSGSHYSALQALEVFLDPADIALKFVGTSWSRTDAAVARKIPAVNVWGAHLYTLEQMGFRRILSTTFMMAFMFARDVNPEDVDKYMRGLVRAQADIDMEPERYKHYFAAELPERYLDLVDVRRFGVGERVVEQPYTQDIFDRTQRWMHDRELFDVGIETGVKFSEAVHG
jgi:NitT/TauT family transport system substrate-binding protein